MSLKHVILKNPRLRGWEYGMLRALENEIIQQTSATTIEVPDYGYHVITKRIGHAMRWDPARKWLPKKPFQVEADVIWYILMGPENYELDLFKDWNIKAKFRIVYVFDTLEPQFNLVQKLFTNKLFNIRITSFNDAVPFLEKLTNSRWYAIEQGVPSSLFKIVPEGQKLIPFSSYGRRHPTFHNILLEFCESNSLYYDYTTHGGSNPTAPESELYKQYAWFISHSIFTVSWPVELTNPWRAGCLHPITCRWFEAASTGTIILGRKPANPAFDDMLSSDLVVDIDPESGKKQLWRQLEDVYQKRSSLMQRSASIAQANQDHWTWTDRVLRMLQLISESD